MYANLPPLNSIRFFDAAARTGSFKRAAEELFVTPTAVSHQIKALEKALGTPLFVRKTRAIELTHDGKILAETAYSVLQQLENTISEISNTKSRIIVSTTPAFAAMWLVPNLSKFNQMHPEIEVAIKTSEYIDDLDKDRQIGVAIRYGIYDDTLPNSSLLVTEKIGMYATPDYIEKLAAGHPATLLETRWQRKDTNLPEFRWNMLMEKVKNDESKNNIREYTQEHHIIQAALAGQGIALVSTLLVENALEHNWLAPCHYEGSAQEIDGLSYYLLVPEHNVNSKGVIAFKSWLKNEMR